MIYHDMVDNRKTERKCTARTLVQIFEKKITALCEKTACTHRRRKGKEKEIANGVLTVFRRLVVRVILPLATSCQGFCVALIWWVMETQFWFSCLLIGGGWKVAWRGLLWARKPKRGAERGARGGAPPRRGVVRAVGPGQVCWVNCVWLRALVAGP